MAAMDVLVIGAGMAGLCTALALADGERRIVLLERDGPPPAEDADAVFADWKRRGVGHLRHSHAFLARLRELIRREHPTLLEALKSAGCREISLTDMLTPLQRPRYRPRPEDAELTILTSRRTTLELVMRRYVESLPGVEIRAGVFVRRLLTAPGPEGVLTVSGVEADVGGETATLQAPVVVDAGGRLSNVVEQLLEAGAPIAEESENAGILYYTRHYRLRPGQTEPPRDRPANGDLGYLKFGVFPADNGCFSVTLAAPEVEETLRQAVVRPEVFDAVCADLPGVAPWTDPARSEPVGRVHGMGDLHSRWREFAPDGRAAVLGVFAVGDSLARSNPLYGRGCSFAAVAAFTLRDVLRTEADPAARAVAYSRAVRRELRPFYDNMRQQDRSAIRRARAALGPRRAPSLRSRLTRSFIEDGVTVATRSDPDLLREALRGFHMLEHPSAWLGRPRNLAKVLGYWARGRRANAAAYPPKPGPRRETLFGRLGLSADADRLAAA